VIIFCIETIIEAFCGKIHPQTKAHVYGMSTKPHTAAYVLEDWGEKLFYSSISVDLLRLAF
jgi:hypothetical protein